MLHVPWCTAAQQEVGPARDLEWLLHDRMYRLPLQKLLDTAHYSRMYRLRHKRLLLCERMLCERMLLERLLHHWMLRLSLRSYSSLLQELLCHPMLKSLSGR